MPALAPVALQLGPAIVDAGSRALSASGVAGAAPSTTASSGDTKTEGSDREAQLKLMEIQRIIDQQKEMFSLVSNLLRSSHELRMGVIENTK